MSLSIKHTAQNPACQGCHGLKADTGASWDPIYAINHCLDCVEGAQLTRIEKGVSEYKKKVDTTYRTGYGTVLFFESHKVLEDWGKKMPNYSKVSPTPHSTQ